MTFLGFFITFFISSFIMVFIFYGLLAGCGLGICYCTATVPPSLYFKKYRDVANGISISGMAVGMIAFPSLIRLSTDSFGWRGGMLILAGISLNTFVIAAVMRPVKKDKDMIIKIDIAQSEEMCDIDQDKEYREEIRTCQDAENSNYTSINGINFTANNQTTDGNLKYNKDRGNDEMQNDSDTANANIPEQENHFANEYNKSSDRVMIKKQNPGIKKNGENTQSSSFDISIFREPFFILFCLYLVSTNIAMSIWFAFIPLMCVHYGTDVLTAGNLIAWSGIPGIFSRIAVGAISNFTGIQPHLFNSIITAVCGGIIMMAPWTCQK